MALKASIKEMREAVEDHNSEKLFKIFYSKPDHFGTAIIGKSDPEPDYVGIRKTHVMLCGIWAKNLGEVFYNMQGEIWSPNGEAR